MSLLLSSGKICIVSYTALDGLIEKDKISVDRFGIVVADESHQLKSKDAKRTINALPFLRKSQIAICLSGTPAINRPVELYTQLSGLLPKVFYDYDQFTRRYCDAKPSRFGGGADVRGSSNEKELNLLLRSLVMIRRLKEDVVKLPTKNREVLYVQADPLFMPELKSIKDHLNSIQSALRDPRNDQSVMKQLKSDQQTSLINYCQVSGLAKVCKVQEELKRIIDDLRVNTNKSADSGNSPVVSSSSSFVSPSCPVDTDMSRKVVIPLDCDDFFEDKVTIVSKNQVVKRESSDDDSDLDFPRKRKTRKTSKLSRLSKNSRASKVITIDSDSDEDFNLDKRCGSKSKSAGRTIVDDDEVVENTASKTNVWKAILDGKNPGKSKPSSKGLGKKDSGSKFGKSSNSEKDSSRLSRNRGKALAQKILIFAHHKNVMDGLEDCVREMDVGYVRIDGDVSISLRDNLINMFQT
jgi:SNF2 family DNA or RNA helicase